MSGAEGGRRRDDRNVDGRSTPRKRSFACPDGGPALYWRSHFCHTAAEAALGHASAFCIPAQMADDGPRDGCVWLGCG